MTGAQRNYNNLFFQKKRKNMKKEKKLTEDIELMHKDLQDKINDADWMEKFRLKEEELEKFRENKLNGSLIRSRFQHNTMGEKPSKYFLNLENKNFISKHIRELN